MWIKAYQNEQYAGVRGQDLHFAPGVNVILGDNEAAPLFDGRSPLTMAEALELRVCRTSLCDGDVHLQLRPAIPQE